MLIHRFVRRSLFTEVTFGIDILKSHIALRTQHKKILRMLLRLQKFCSATAMFAESRTGPFSVVLAVGTRVIVRNSMIKMIQ